MSYLYVYPRVLVTSLIFIFCVFVCAFNYSCIIGKVYTSFTFPGLIPDANSQHLTIRSLIRVRRFNHPTSICELVMLCSTIFTHRVMGSAPRIFLYVHYQVNVFSMHNIAHR